MADVCLARQPIFDTVGAVIGYELLYRRFVTDTAAGGVEHSVMGADVLVNACLNIGLQQLTSGRTVYLNFTRDMLLSRAYTLLPPDAVVIELLDFLIPAQQRALGDEQARRAGYARWAEATAQVIVLYYAALAAADHVQ